MLFRTGLTSKLPVLMGARLLTTLPKEGSLLSAAFFAKEIDFDFTLNVRFSLISEVTLLLAKLVSNS